MNNDILYKDKIMLPDRNAEYISIVPSEELSSSHPFVSFVSFENALNSITTTDHSIIRIYNKTRDIYDILTQKELDEYKGLSISEFKDEICKKAVFRYIELSHNKKEIYGERFIIRGEMNYKHTFIFDYDVLYGRNKSYKPGEFVLSDYYKDTTINEPLLSPSDIMKKPISLKGLDFKIACDSPYTSESKYSGEKDVYACISGEVCYLEDKAGIVPKKLGSEYTWYGMNSFRFIPKASIKSGILTSSGSFIISK